jgi:hypothetical protein
MGGGVYAHLCAHEGPLGLISLCSVEAEKVASAAGVCVGCWV